MKFLTRRESERDTYEGRPPTSSKRSAMDSNGMPAQAGPAQASPRNMKPDSPPSITMQTPDNVIGETLVVQGRVEFKNLLRIDGHFEGELVGNGSLIIGPTAEVISNLKGLHEVYVEGILIGDSACEKMQIRFAGCVTGNIQCASLGMDPSVVLKGSANVNPRDRNDKMSDRSKSRGNPPRHSHNRQRSQARMSADQTASSSRPSHGLTATLNPDSDDESISVLADDPKLTVSFDDGKLGRSYKSKSGRSRTNGSGSTSSTSATSATDLESHSRVSSTESSGSSTAPAISGDGEKGTVPRLGDSITIPVRTRQSMHQIPASIPMSGAT